MRLRNPVLKLKETIDAIKLTLQLKSLLVHFTMVPFWPGNFLDNNFWRYFYCCCSNKRCECESAMQLFNWEVTYVESPFNVCKYLFANDKW